MKKYFKTLQKILILLMMFFVVSCRNYPKTAERLAGIVVNSVRNSNLKKIWSLYTNNPKIRKYILLKEYRSGRITKPVYQKEMGRIIHFEKKEKKKLKADFNRIIKTAKAFNISFDTYKIQKHEQDKNYFTILIGKGNRTLKLNVHYRKEGGNFFILSIYSIT